MDLITGLATARQALDIVKSLRDIERDLDSASYKSQMAELYSALADVKIALSDAQTTLHEKDQKIRSLEETIESMKSGESCPLCETGRLKVVQSKSHPHFGFAGVQERTLKCQNPACGHSEIRLHDPDNRTGTNKR
jgi:chromosome segregation ATPase